MPVMESPQEYDARESTRLKTSSQKFADQAHNDKLYSLSEWKRLRQQCRTSLWFLCQVMQYPDVGADHPRAHLEMQRTLQHFKGGEDKLDKVHRRDGAGYTPFIGMWDMTPLYYRQNLILVSRDFLKSTICTQAHSVQWIINYPDIRILFSSGVVGQVEKFLIGVRNQFLSNEMFRWLFPEHVPWGREAREWGSTKYLLTLARRDFTLREKTIDIVAVGSTVAGGHYDVQKNDDVVDKENVRTPESIAAVKSHITYLGPLLQRRYGKAGWVDFIGTRYDYSDMYGQILDAEKAKPKERRTFRIVFAPAYTGRWNTEDCKAAWPERYPISELQRIENDPTQGPDVLASQYGLKPRPDASGLVDRKEQIRFIPRSEINQLITQWAKHVTIDLNGMAFSTNPQKQTVNDFTCVNLTGWDEKGIGTCIEMLHGRPPIEQVVDYLFSLYHRYPDIVDIKCQEDHMFRYLLPYLQRSMAERKIVLPIFGIPINNQISKKQRLRGLRPWLVNGQYRFAADLACRNQVEEEIMRFPRFTYDDIIDTCRDQLENASGGLVTHALPHENVPLQERTTLGEPPRFLGFGPDGAEMWSRFADDTEAVVQVDRFTGF